METLIKKGAAAAERIRKFLGNANKTGKDKRNEEFLNARLQLLESYWNTFCNIHDELVSVASAEELKSSEYFLKDTFSEIECVYIESLGWLKEQLKPLQPKRDPNESTILNSTGASSTAADSIVRLPKINLPTFSGPYSEWPSFHDTFVSLIHENGTLSDVQKMHYLKSAITGEAAKLLRHFSITSANYKSAWKTILERFENKRLLVNSNLQSIISLPQMSSESPSELRRVLDNFNQAVRTLENLSRPVEQWDDWLVYFLCSKLDNTTRKDWETSLESSTEMPTLHSLRGFLETRLHALSFIKNTDHNHTIRQPKVLGKPQPYRAARSYHASSSKRCFSCKGNHILLFCPQFRAKSIDERIDFLRRNNICTNCMRAQHATTACPSSNRCQRCQQMHHTMVHKTPQATPSGSQHFQSTITSQAASGPVISTTSAHLSNNTSNAILLATAIVLVRSPDGRIIKARALLDQGSESNFITQSVANLLNLTKREVNISVLGVGQCEAGIVRTVVTHEIISTLESRCRYSIQSLVLPTLTQLIPSKPIHKQDWPHLIGLTLADPDFEKSARIDLILGAEVYANILLNEVQRGPQGSPIAQATSFGWILSGHIGNTSSTPTSMCSFHSSSVELNSLLKRFWEIEEPPTATRLTPEESECEEFFRMTHRRDDTGRFIVRLPLRCPDTELGSSRTAATYSLLQLERRFKRDSILYQAYSDFLSEYLNLNHMELVPAEQEDVERAYYLPHHPVLKPSSTTTKLRVVFNASMKTSST